MSHGKHVVLDDKCTVTAFADEQLARSAVLAFCNSALAYDNDHRYEEHFYGRRLRPHILKHLDFSKWIDNREDALSYAAFAANRVLYAMNELDFLMLPQNSELDQLEFQEFYSDGRQAAAAVGRPYLEKYLFRFLKKEIIIDGNWTLARVREYFQSRLGESNQLPESLSVQAIRNSKDPRNALRDFLIQLAPDFLVESSPMSRYAGGSYGELCSSLFKVIIDELGYGHHPSRHSTLYEKTLASADLSPDPHRYWQYYLNSSLMLANYYNMVTRDKRNVFRYIGAIYQAETGFITACAEWKKCIQDIAPSIDVKYFEEHCHIDKDHSRMALETLVFPAIERYGSHAACEIVRGYEEAVWLGNHFDRDFSDQIKWKDAAEDFKGLHRRIASPVLEAQALGRVGMDQFVEPTGELSITHSHDGDELCHVVSGTMEFLNGFEKSTILHPGEGIIIKKNRLHGALIEQGPCTYQIYNIQDSSRWP